MDLPRVKVVMPVAYPDKSLEALTDRAWESIRSWTYPTIDVSLATREMRTPRAPVTRRELGGLLNEAARRSDLRHPDPDYYVFMHNDTYAPPGVVGQLVHHMQQHPDLGAVGVMTNRAYHFWPQWYIGKRPENPEQVKDLHEELAKNGKGLLECPFFVGHFYVVRAEAFQDVHGFDGSNFRTRTHEETDLLWRMHKRGWRTAIDRSAYVHHGPWGYTDRVGPTRKALGKPTRELLTNTYRLGRLHGHKKVWLGFSALWNIPGLVYLTGHAKPYKSKG